MRILIVDDEEDLRAMLHRMLDVSGHAVVEAAEGKEALAVLAREPIDLVITDVIMPEMDGIELMRKMKQHHPHVKTIVLSACDFLQEELFLNIARLMGAAGAFKKFTNRDELLTAVESIARDVEQPRKGSRREKGRGKVTSRVRPAQKSRKTSVKRHGRTAARIYRNPVAEAAMEQALRRAAA